MTDTRFPAAASDSPDDRTPSEEEDGDRSTRPSDERPSNERFDVLLDALSAPRRRIVAEYFEEHERATLRELAEAVAERESPDAPDVDAVEISLHHSHVPKLVDVGLLAYDGDRKQFRRGDRSDVTALLN